MSHQVALTIIIRIKPGETEALKQLLGTMSDNVANNALIPFGKLSRTHFARLTVLDESIDSNGSVIAPSLVFMIDCDAPLGRTLSEPHYRGLHFICFCANIARQFEFVQHTWINNPNFNALYDDNDPIIGAHHPKGGTFIVQAKPVRKRVIGLPRFVSVLGGAYFFMPGIMAIRYLASLGR